MSAISGAFVNPFGTSGQLGVGLASILGGNAAGTSNAATVAASGAAATGPFAALASAAASNAGNTATLEALGEGKLTTTQHNIIAALGAAPDFTASIPWNSGGVEPTELAQMRQDGWIKLVKPNYDSSTRLVTAASYELTEVGKAIYLRTGGGQVTSGDSSSSSSSGSGVDITA